MRPLAYCISSAQTTKKKSGGPHLHFEASQNAYITLLNAIISDSNNFIEYDGNIPPDIDTYIFSAGHESNGVSDLTTLGQWHCNQSHTNSGHTTLERSTIICSTTGLTINGIIYPFIEGPTFGFYYTPVVLGCLCVPNLRPGKPSRYTNFATFDIWRLTIKNTSGQIVNDYVPVRDENGNGALYDNVTGQTYKASGGIVEYVE